MKQIEIDSGSGFCFGVTTAIKKAEEDVSDDDHSEGHYKKHKNLDSDSDDDSSI